MTSTLPSCTGKGTRDHEVSQNIAALLGAVEAEPPFAPDCAQLLV